MSVLADIIGEVETLLEGSTGVDRTVASGKLTLVGSDHEFQFAQCTADPRPFYIEVGEEYEDDTMPSDVSGDYLYRARRLTILVAYGYIPEDTPMEREVTIADDEKIFVSCLTWPLNWALVTDWCGAEVTADRLASRDSDGVIAIQFLKLGLDVSYREDIS